PPRKSKSAPVTAAGGKGKRRAPSPCTYTCTEELLAASRWRYENSTDSVADIAADMGCHTTTLQKMANRLFWVRYKPPPHGLSRAAQIEKEAEALLSPSHPGRACARPGAGPGGGGSRAESARGGVSNGAVTKSSASGDAVHPTPPLADARGDPPPPGEGTVPLAETIARLHRAVAGEIAVIEAAREKLGDTP